MPTRTDTIKDLAGKLAHLHGQAGVTMDAKNLYDWCDDLAASAITDDVMDLLRLEAKPDDVKSMVRTLTDAANALTSTAQLPCAAVFRTD